MRKIFINILNSFTTDKEGYSARKLSAFAAVSIGIFITVKLLPKEVMIDALYAWLGFSLLCMGLIRVEQLIDLRSGGKSNDQPAPVA